MEYRTLDVTLESAKGLELKKYDSVYAVAYISGYTGNIQHKYKTHDNKTDDTTWNYPTKFAMAEVAAQQNHLTLVIKIKAKRVFVDKKVGEVRVPVKGLMEGVTVQGKPMQAVSYQLTGKGGGVVNFTYKFSEIYLRKVKRKPVATTTEARGVYLGGQQGRGTSSGTSLRFGTGLISGLLVADIVSHTSPGGGCNGGGCGGGGCGGGGCGGC